MKHQSCVHSYCCPRVVISIGVHDGQHVDVHVVQDVGNVFVKLVRRQRLWEKGRSFQCPTTVKLRPFHPTDTRFNILTCCTNHKQKAGEIHSLAWIPQSIHIAFLFGLLLRDNWEKIKRGGNPDSFVLNVCGNKKVKMMDEHLYRRECTFRM